MKQKNLIICTLLVMAVFTLSISVVSADDLETVKTGQVTGGVLVNGTENFQPLNSSDPQYLEFNQELPENLSGVDYAGLYINIYSGSGQPTYGANSTIEVRLPNSTSLILSSNNILKHPTGLGNIANDPTTYNLSNYSETLGNATDVNLQYSDYQLYFDLTPYLSNITSGNINVIVNSSALSGYNLDARVKMIALVLAYNTTGSNDTYDYIVNAGQSWTNDAVGPVNTTFDTSFVTEIVTEATLQNIALSSGDGQYNFTDNILNTSNTTGFISTYYKYHNWDVTSFLGEVLSDQYILQYKNLGAGAYSSFKNVLSVLTLKEE